MTSMRRVMIVGQPGAGKSTLARALGDRTFLPVYHMDRIHRMPVWIERSQADKTRMALDVAARERWIFEGGHSATWPQRLARADTLIWLDLPVMVRLVRVMQRRVQRRQRPDLPENCPERIDPAFLRFIWRTRVTSRAKIAALYRDAVDKRRYRLTSGRAVRHWLADLDTALAVGHLGISHR